MGLCGCENSARVGEKQLPVRGVDTKTLLESPSFTSIIKQKSKNDLPKPTVVRYKIRSLHPDRLHIYA